MYEIQKESQDVKREKYMTMVTLGTTRKITMVVERDGGCRMGKGDVCT